QGIREARASFGDRPLDRIVTDALRPFDVARDVLERKGSPVGCIAGRRGRRAEIAQGPRTMTAREVAAGARAGSRAEITEAARNAAVLRALGARDGEPRVAVRVHRAGRAAGGGRRSGVARAALVAVAGAAG